MTFLNSILLGGLAAASIPIIIHLLHRRRVRVIRWGAMHLLEATLRKNQRRLRWEQIILLIIRCLIPAILALALARPVITRLQSLFGSARSSLVVLLDNSYSMDARNGQQSSFEAARALVSRKLESLPRGSDVAIELMSGGNVSGFGAPTTDLGALNERLNELESGYGRAATAEALTRAAGHFAAMKNGFREVLLVSDFQRLNWSGPEADARNRAVGLLRDLEVPPQFSFLRVGATPEANVAVESLALSRLIAGVGQPVQVRATVRNFGDQSWDNLRVFFRADDVEKNAVQVSLAPREQKQLLFNHTFETAGSHVLEVFADADALKADNTALHAIQVWDRVPVLLVNGEPSNTPLRGETDFLEIALQPFGLGKVNLADLLSARTVGINDLTADTLNSVKVCVLANVAQLTDRQLSQVRDFVRDGGGLLVFPGPRLNIDWWNRTALPTRLLPLPLIGLGGAAANPPATARVVAQPFTHPALELFNDQRNGRLSDGEVQTWFKLGGAPNTNSPVTILASLDSGDPFLVEQALGEGRVLYCNTSADTDWSNLPTRPFYLPLMQSLVTYLASTINPPRNLAVGKTLLAFAARGDIGKRAVITAPSGKRTEVPIARRNDRGALEFAGTAQPGTYTVTLPDNTVLHYVVSAPREESDLARLSDDEIATFAKEMDADVADSWETYQAVDRNRRFGRELWRPLLYAVLALLFTELILQQWFARRAR